jgi:hypothetical protein
VAKSEPSFFARYINIDEPKKQPVALEIEHAQRLLDWLQGWSKPTICAREICIYGPRPIRKREKAGSAAKILEKNGWLRRIPTHRYDMEAWQIVRRPIIYPDCSRVAD